ncbi:MAG: hypothetical protein ACPG6X_03000 [Synechococcus sp.]
MTYKYWASPFPVDPSLQSSLNDAGMMEQSWQHIDSLPATEVLLLFNPPDLILTQFAPQIDPILSDESQISHLCNIYQRILNQAQAYSTPLAAAWQLQAFSQTITLAELFSLDSDHYPALRQDSVQWPSIDILAGLGVQQLDHHVDGQLTNLYVQLDQLAIKFGRQSDNNYSERINQELSEKAIVQAFQDIQSLRQRETFVIEGLHKTQREFRDYVLETKAIIKKYQELLHHSQVIAGHYRDDIAKGDQGLTST